MRHWAGDLSSHLHFNPSNFHLLVHTPFVYWGGGGGSAKVVLSLERAFDCFLLTLACLCCLCLLMLYVFLRLLSLLFPMGSPFSIGDSGSFFFLLVFSWLNGDWELGGGGVGWGNKKNENTRFFFVLLSLQIGTNWHGFFPITVSNGILIDLRHNYIHILWRIKYSQPLLFCFRSVNISR